MTLADVQFPVALEWSRSHALVFGADIASRLSAVQQEVGDPRYHLQPSLLSDGRYMVGADLLTECVDDGFLRPAFQKLDQAKFASISVVPMTEVLLLLPSDSA